jgi:DnaJ-class molecular chaperone
MKKILQGQRIEMKNYYKILGIKPNSTAAEIKSAYERLLDWQDKSPDTYTEQRQQEIDEAFDTLVDPIAREEYDQKFHQYEAQRREQQRRAAGRTKRGCEDALNHGLSLS